jgi:hypothetical protein
MLPNWRHLHDLQPTIPSNPVLWLAQEDAEAFCYWWTNRLDEPSPYSYTKNNIWQNNGLRLPSAEELDIFPKDYSDNQWEWTCNNLADFPEHDQSYKEYLTLWHPKDHLLHRRVRDLNFNTKDPVTFRLAWTE